MGTAGLLVIATGNNWVQYREEIIGSRFEYERAAEWALRINEARELA